MNMQSSSKKRNDNLFIIECNIKLYDEEIDLLLNDYLKISE